jgi:pilus assembly protein CpaE
MQTQTKTMTALVTLESGIEGAGIASVLSAIPGVETTAVVDGLQDGWDAISDRTTDVVILVCDPGSEPALAFIREATRLLPERPLVVLCGASPNGFVRHVFEAGADDLVLLDDRFGVDPAAVAEPLRFALEKAVARRSGATAGAGTALGSLICVLGPKGGIGKTLASANLGAALAADGHKVVVVDLDLQFGDVGLSLGLEPKRTIYDLAKSGGSLDSDKVEAYLTPHSSGARVLMAPMRPDQAGAVTTDFLRELYPLLRAANDYVVVDTPPGFAPEVITSIDSSTHVCLVGMLDSLSLKNTKLGLETLELMGYERDRVLVVLNRADTSVGVTQDDVAAVIGRRPEILVPSHRDVVRSVNEGVPIVQSRPRSEVARAFRALAAAYTGVPERGSRRLRLWRKG